MGDFSDSVKNKKSNMIFVMKERKLKLEKKLGRAIQIIFYDEAKINLQNSILNGFIIEGGW
mgnify:CR=1 FL=1